MTAHSIYQDSAQPITARVEDLLAQMTLEEKIGQLGSFWIFEVMDAAQVELVPEKAQQRMAHGLGQVTRIAGASARSASENARVANTIQRYLKEHTRLSIPAIVHEECCCGYMALGATVFPEIIGLASTWKPERAAQMTEVIRQQMRAVGAHQGLSPVLDTARDPRWGRFEETFGEDPTLIAQFGVAYVKGLQAHGNLAEGVLATGKHFIGHGISEGGMNCTPVQLGPRDLRDIYLLPFEAVIRDGGLASMMNAYSEVDGITVAASRRILTDLLRDELGFTGLLVSDYEAIDMVRYFHHVAGDQMEAAKLCLEAGIDLETPSTACYGQPLLEGVRAGRISEAYVDTAVRRVLQKKFELGLFENPFVDEAAAPALYDTTPQRQLALAIARESLILLKNDNATLPLDQTKIKTLAVIGPNADTSRCMVGDYSHTAQIQSFSSFLESLRTIKEKANVEIGPEGSVIIPTVLQSIRAQAPHAQVLYAKGCEVLGDDLGQIPEALRVTQQSDAVVLVVGDRSGLTLECSTGESRDRATLGLPGAQEALVKQVLALGKPTVVVFISGRPVSSPHIAAHAAAILNAWIPGEEGATAIAEAIFGATNPGGKLPVTIVRDSGQIPLFYNHKPSGGASRWHVDYVDMPTSPLYPFGHGLSYTQFAYSDLQINNVTPSPQHPVPASADRLVAITLTLANTGPSLGDEVVQLYTRDLKASLSRPVKELRAFQRLTLQPGQSKRITFHLDPAQLAFYNADLQLVLEPGEFEVMIGASSADIRLNGRLSIEGTQPIAVRKRVYQCLVQVF